MQVKILTTDMDKQSWIQERRSGIGGSDAGTIAGLNPWKSPVQLYLEKTGQIDDCCVANEEACYWGTALEDMVAREFSKRSGLKVRRRNAILQHPEHDFMLANVDRLIVGIEEGLECKTASFYMKDKWKDGHVPDMYMAQIQHYMAVTGYKAWWLAVLIAGNDFRYQRVERDDEFIDMLIKLEKNFWEDNVLAGVMPEPDGTSACSDVINQMFPDGHGETVLDASHEKAVKDFEEYSALEKQYKELKDEAANRLKMAVGDNERGLLTNHVVIWKPVTSKRIDTKRLKAEQPSVFNQYANESSYRRFSIKEI